MSNTKKSSEWCVAESEGMLTGALAVAAAGL